MSPLTRMRTLAAALALLLFLAATPAAAHPGKPTERPEGPGPGQEVGEPDTGHQLTWNRLWLLIRVSFAATPTLRWIAVPARPDPRGFTLSRSRGAGGKE